MIWEKSNDTLVKLISGTTLVGRRREEIRNIHINVKIRNIHINVKVEAKHKNL